MKATRKKLEKAWDKQKLVTIRRNACRGGGVQAFVIDVSKHFVLLQQVCDFHLDGLFLFRISDISGVNATDTDKFHRKLLIQEEEFELVDFARRLPIQSYQALLESLPEDQIFIIEDEISTESRFLIGTLDYVDEDIASVHYFDGVAKWLDERSIIKTEKITSCQIESNYINYYQRYFYRQKLKKKE